MRLNSIKDSSIFDTLTEVPSIPNLFDTVNSVLNLEITLEYGTKHKTIVSCTEDDYWKIAFHLKKLMTNTSMPLYRKNIKWNSHAYSIPIIENFVNTSSIIDVITFPKRLGAKLYFKLNY